MQWQEKQGEGGWGGCRCGGERDRAVLPKCPLLCWALILRPHLAPM